MQQPFSVKNSLYQPLVERGIKQVLICRENLLMSAWIKNQIIRLFFKIVFDKALGSLYKNSHTSNDEACSCFKS